MPKTKVGHNLYRHHIRNDNTRCIISSHGGYRMHMTFPVPVGTTVHFYNQQGQTQRGDHLRRLLIGTLDDMRARFDTEVPVETITGGNNCRDHWLSKFQTGGGGIYARGVEGYLSIEAWLRTTTCGNMDVITIRNRDDPRFEMQDGMRLSQVITEMQQAHPYNEYFCSFCRTPIT